MSTDSQDTITGMTNTSVPRLNERPPRSLLSWGVFYDGEPFKGQHCVHVTVWVPSELSQWEQEHCWDSSRCRLTRLAAYLQEHLGFEVCISGGWSSASVLPGQELSAVGVPVRARGVRAALAAQ